MNAIKRMLLGANLLMLTILASCSRESDYVGLSLIPPGTITDKVDLDVRAGIVNKGTSADICISEILQKNACFLMSLLP